MTSNSHWFGSDELPNTKAEFTKSPQQNSGEMVSDEVLPQLLTRCRVGLQVLRLENQRGSERAIVLCSPGISHSTLR